MTSRRTIASLALLALFLTEPLLGPTGAKAQSMIDYTAFPFGGGTASNPPNILFIYDASSSMHNLASDKINSGDWSETLTYAGLWDPLKCYVYDSSDARFEYSDVKTGTGTGIAQKCKTTEWDGNFLNYALVTRFDVAKLAMNGGACWHPDMLDPAKSGRNADLTCKQYGSPLNATVTLGHTFDPGNDQSSTSTPAIPSSKLSGRVPDSVVKGGLATAPSSIYIHMGTPGLKGAFCVDNDSTAPSSTATSCSDSDTFAEGQFFNHLAMESEPRGVLQEVGNKARWGLMMFSDDHIGRLTVPVGAKQNVDLDPNKIETFSSNLAAMVDAIDDVYFESGTPGVEAQYQALRYLSQVSPVYASDGGFYTWAFPSAVGLAVNGTGSLGTDSSGNKEESVLTGSETCPAGYVTNACGRDPYFFGSNHTPAWASPSAVVSCCESYIIYFTDGNVSGDATGVPDAFNTYFSSKIGALLSGYSTGEHKLISMAYWMNGNDLRGGLAIPGTSDVAPAIAGDQKVKVYTFYLFGGTDGRALLQETGKYGGFTDENGNGKPDNGSTTAPGPCDMVDLTKPCEWDKATNDTGAAVRDGIPDTYFESTSAADVKNKIGAAVASILQKSSSGTAAVILASSSTGEGAVYQAYFNPSTVEGLKEVRWLGYLHSLWADARGNLREDTDGDGRLVYNKDKIIVTRFDATAGEVVVDRYADADGDGKADSGTCSPCGVSLKDLLPI